MSFFKCVYIDLASLVRPLPEIDDTTISVDCDSSLTIADNFLAPTAPSVLKNVTENYLRNKVKEMKSLELEDILLDDWDSFSSWIKEIRIHELEFHRCRFSKRGAQTLIDLLSPTTTTTTETTTEKKPWIDKLQLSPITDQVVSARLPRLKLHSSITNLRLYGTGAHTFLTWDDVCSLLMANNHLEEFHSYNVTNDDERDPKLEKLLTDNILNLKILELCFLFEVPPQFRDCWRAIGHVIKQSPRLETLRIKEMKESLDDDYMSEADPVNALATENKAFGQIVSHLVNRGNLKHLTIQECVFNEKTREVLQRIDISSLESLELGRFDVDRFEDKAYFGDGDGTEFPTLAALAQQLSANKGPKHLRIDFDHAYAGNDATSKVVATDFVQSLYGNTKIENLQIVVQGGTDNILFPHLIRTISAMPNLKSWSFKGFIFPVKSATVIQWTNLFLEQGLKSKFIQNIQFEWTMNDAEEFTQGPLNLYHDLLKRQIKNMLHCKSMLRHHDLPDSLWAHVFYAVRSRHLLFFLLKEMPRLVPLVDDSQQQGLADREPAVPHAPNCPGCHKRPRRQRTDW